MTALPNCAPAPTPDIGSVLDEISGYLDRIESGVSTVFSTISGLFTWLLPWVQDKVNSLLDTVNAQMTTFFREIGEILAHVGNPSALNRAGNSWVTHVGGPAVSEAGLLDPAILPTAGTWTGSAYEAYTARTGKQTDAAKELMPRATRMDEELATMGSAIVAFWLEMAVGVAAFVVAIGIAIAEACGVVTIPVAVATVLGAVAAAIALIGVAVTQTMNVVTASTEIMVQIRADISGSFAYPGGSWPPATAG